VSVQLLLVLGPVLGGFLDGTLPLTFGFISFS
jgi:hypothetical protein